MSTHNLSRRLARQGGDLAFQLSDAGFARVVLNQPFQSCVRQFHEFGLQAMLFQLPRHQEAFGDL